VVPRKIKRERGPAHDNGCKKRTFIGAISSKKKNSLCSGKRRGGESASGRETDHDSTTGKRELLLA